MLTLIDRNGPPEAQTCPAFLCDVCGDPTYGENGLAAWKNAKHVDNRAEPFTVWTVHKGKCIRGLEEKLEHKLMTRRLDEFAQQLAHNVANPFTEKKGVEYVAPSPSTWKLGTYQR